MEAVGAAATIIGLVQTGLSLAKALNTYAGTVHDYNDDIAVVADDIYATYRHLNDLGEVLKKNEKVEILTSDALESAQRCIRQAEILIRKLKKLLVKGYGSDDAGEIVESKQIDISKFKKGIWYIYKSEFELRRSELAQIKADISLIYLTYLALSANSTTERKQAQDEMELVYNRKIVLNRKVKMAREQRDRDVEEGIVDENQDGAEDIYAYPPELEDTAIVYDDVEALYREFENWLTQKEQKAAALAADRKKLEEDILSRHEDEVREKAEKTRIEAQKLRDVLLQHGVPPQRVVEITKDVFPDSARLSAGETIPAGAGESTALPSSERGVSMRKAKTGSFLDVLRDLNEPGGIAQLKAFYLQRIYASPTRSEIMKLEVAVSAQNLLQRRGKITSTSELNPFEEFGGIPEDYVLQIRQELENLQDRSETWILLQAEPVKKKSHAGRSRLGLRKKTQDEVVGVQVVFRKVSARNNTWQSEEDKPTETFQVQSSPRIAASIPMRDESWTPAGRDYWLRHASQIIPRSGIAANYSLDRARRRVPVERERWHDYRSPDTSPEPSLSERRTRFAPQVIAIPSPRYDDSPSDETSSRVERPFRQEYPRFYPQSISRQESVASVEGGQYAERRRDRVQPFSRRIVTERDSEDDSEIPMRSRFYEGRAQSVVTSYAQPQRRARRRATMNRPRLSRARVSSDGSDDEVEKTVLQVSPELPSDVAVHSILRKWGTCTDESVRDFDTGTETLVSGPMSRRSTFDVNKEDSHFGNSTKMPFNAASTNGSV